jgi:hypothetical protein
VWRLSLSRPVRVNGRGRGCGRRGRRGTAGDREAVERANASAARDQSVGDGQRRVAVFAYV